MNIEHTNGISTQDPAADDLPPVSTPIYSAAQLAAHAQYRRTHRWVLVAGFAGLFSMAGVTAAEGAGAPLWLRAGSLAALAASMTALLALKGGAFYVRALIAHRRAAQR